MESTTIINLGMNLVSNLRFQQFGLGFLGAITYFIGTWSGFIPLLTEDFFLNPKLKNSIVVLFFSLIAGLLCVISDIRNLVMCFAYGLAIRPVLISLYEAGRKNGKKLV